MSEASAPKVYVAISEIARQMSQQGIGKEHRNQQQGYNFRGIDDVLNSLSPLLAKHHLVILPRIIKRDQTERTGKSGGALFYTVVQAEFDIVSALDGSKHTVQTFGEAMDSADKGTNKALSAAYKYACIQVFCIPTEGTPDADAETNEVVSTQAPNQKTWGGKEEKPTPAPQFKRDPRIDEITRKTITAWFMDILNPETFQRNEETVSFEKIKAQIIKDSSILPEKDQIDLRREAYFNWLLCMVTTASGDEQQDGPWEEKIKNSKLSQKSIEVLTKLLHDHQEAVINAGA